MDPSTMTPMQIILASALVGLVAGLVPLAVGVAKKNIKYGVIGLVGSIVGGAALGLILAVPVAAIFTWLIIRSNGAPKLDDA